MTKILSKERTNLAYDGTPEVEGPLHPSLAEGVRIVIHPGINEVSDNDYAVLWHDRNFRHHVETGFIVVVDEDEKPLARPPAPQPFVPAPVAAVNDAEADPDVLFPVREKPLVSPEEHNAALGAGTPEAAKLPKKRQGDVDAYYAMTDADRAVTYPTLTGQAKADVDADPRAPKVTA